jgi:glycogen debranching enzyme
MKHTPLDLTGSLRAKSSSLFAVSGANGDIDTRVSNAYGIYFHDTRFLERWTLRLDGQPLSTLLSNVEGSRVVCELTNPDIQLRSGDMLHQHRIGVRRELCLGADAVETVEVSNFDLMPVTVTLDLEFAASFENMFVIRGERQGKRGKLHSPRWQGQSLRFEYEGADGHRRTTVLRFSPPPTSHEDGVVSYTLELKRNHRASIKVTAGFREEGTGDLERTPQQSSAEPLNGVSVVTDNALFDRTLQQSFDDLRMLVTREHGDVFFAAGVPWFVALFGRDSLITSLQTLAFDPSIAANTLDLLAKYQGSKVDDYRDEQPGKIMHELRLGEMPNLGEVPQTPYYGSVDATPLFVTLMAEYVRWTGDLALWRRLRPNVARALEWIDRYGDSDGDGFTDYQTRSSKGGRNQGWKDSANGIVNSDGSLADPPIALVEVQGYVYRAKLDAAWLLRCDGDHHIAAELEKQAQALQRRFREVFWMRERRFLALGRQQDGRPIESINSNPGQALWSGIVSPPHARAVTSRLMGEGMFSGWGIRTLAENEAAYNPIDYQVGSVWPHDNSMIAAGFKRYGRDHEALRVFTAMFDAAARFPDFRLPEVFAGFPRELYPVPVQYPVACSPQAWAAGTLPHLLISVLGLSADATQGVLEVNRPHLPEWLGEVTLSGLCVGETKLSLTFRRSEEATLVALKDRRGVVDLRITY